MLKMCSQVSETGEKSSENETKETEAQISDIEAELYDRQIRLWGVSAQKKLRSADVLIAGINGIGSEIVKNIILSGVNSITLLDDENVTIYDTLSNLFTNRQIGQNRAEVALKPVQSLNPMVSVKYENSKLNEKPKEYFEAYQVVCLCNYDKQTMISVNKICNDLNIKFYATCNWGSYGFTFTDLGIDHKYFAEENTETDDVLLDEPKEKKPKLEVTKRIVEKKVSFALLETALGVKAGKPGFGLTKRTNSVLFITHVMLEFNSKHSRYPSVDSRESDIEELKKLQIEVLERLGFEDSILKNNKDWMYHILGELSPICAIIGGVLAQDVIRAISAKDSPIRNFFLFDGIHLNGSIESVGK